MEQRVQELEHQLKLLKRCLFGSRSEKVSAEELEARIAGHVREAVQAVGDSKRPDEPPAEAEEEKAEMRPPESPFGRPMACAQSQWEARMRYLKVPGAELDNPSIEHALRRVVMGRRNWLHVGQEVGGGRAANLFTLMGSCRRLGVESYEYLCDIVPLSGSASAKGHLGADASRLAGRPGQGGRPHRSALLI